MHKRRERRKRDCIENDQDERRIKRISKISHSVSLEMIGGWTENDKSVDHEGVVDVEEERNLLAARETE